MVETTVDANWIPVFVKNSLSASKQNWVSSEQLQYDAEFMFKIASALRDALPEGTRVETPLLPCFLYEGKAGDQLTGLVQVRAVRVGSSLTAEDQAKEIAVKLAEILVENGATRAFPYTLTAASASASLAGETDFYFRHASVVE